MRYDLNAQGVYDWIEDEAAPVAVAGIAPFSGYGSENDGQLPGPMQTYQIFFRDGTALDGAALDAASTRLPNYGYTPAAPAGYHAPTARELSVYQSYSDQLAAKNNAGFDFGLVLLGAATAAVGGLAFGAFGGGVGAAADAAVAAPVASVGGNAAFEVGGLAGLEGAADWSAVAAGYEGSVAGSALQNAALAAAAGDTAAGAALAQAIGQEAAATMIAEASSILAAAPLASLTPSVPSAGTTSAAAPLAPLVKAATALIAPVASIAGRLLGGLFNSAPQPVVADTGAIAPSSGGGALLLLAGAAYVVSQS